MHPRRRRRIHAKNIKTSEDEEEIDTAQIALLRRRRGKNLFLA